MHKKTFIKSIVIQKILINKKNLNQISFIFSRVHKALKKIIVEESVLGKAARKLPKDQMGISGINSLTCERLR